MCRVKVVSLNEYKAEKAYKHMGTAFNYNAALDTIHREVSTPRDIAKELTQGYIKLLNKGGEIVESKMV